MVRPREFDSEVVLQRAMRVFWQKGYAATSTEDLLTAMGIGRQSLYNTFGDKQKLYRAALSHYQQMSTAAHIKRLNASASPKEGILNMLLALAVDDDAERAMGCMGVSSACEFGTSDQELVEQRNVLGARLLSRLSLKIEEGQTRGELDPTMDAGQAAAFVLTSMSGIQVAARGGLPADSLRAMAHFIVERLSIR